MLAKTRLKSSLPRACPRSCLQHHSAGLGRGQRRQQGQGPRSTSTAAAPDGGGRWVNGTYIMEMHVRDYELDQFGVVNNAVFASYIQHGRHEAFRAMGFPIDSMTDDGSALALASLSLQYLAPLRSRDAFELSVWVEKMTGVRLVIGHSIKLTSPGRPDDARQAGQTVLKAEAVVVWLDKKYAPVRIPADVRQAFASMQETHTQAVPVPP